MKRVKKGKRGKRGLKGKKVTAGIFQKESHFGEKVKKKNKPKIGFFGVSKFLALHDTPKLVL